ncbi:GDSL esterase/lipase At5g55050-like [Magnolia sinica]|uniref:GDSL esterase/lipase At5g55050-like n=1 Tax=Magnolia sinica TaxID=86752 RepID=UPI00265957D8|nr:GDSL esterase/lipase At5g55050-like [Magnolia sinica]
MAGKRMPFLFFLLSLSFFATSTAVPAIFIFGDSTADVGNNNFLSNTISKADFPHNGIDFPHSRPTGRFSNGYNSADFLAKLHGFRRSPPAFLSLPNASFRKKFFTGVNFAGGGSGLLEITGIILGEVISMKEQVENFAMVCSNLTAHRGSEATEMLLSKSLFLISIGSNDIFQDFFFYGPTNSAHKDRFIARLASEYKDHLKVSNIYKLGARKFGIISVPPIGCCPYQRLKNDTTWGCLEDMNESARRFYHATDVLLRELSSELKGMKYSLGNAYEMVIDVIDHPDRHGFKNITSACCGGGKLNGETECDRQADLCSNRRDYLFWDMFHPTQAASKMAADTLYAGLPRFVTPTNFKQLAENDS